MPIRKHTIDINIQPDLGRQGAGVTLDVHYHVDHQGDIDIRVMQFMGDGEPIAAADWLLDLPRLNESIYEELYEHEASYATPVTPECLRA
jgi:hypothetical protein